MAMLKVLCLFSFIYMYLSLSELRELELQNLLKLSVQNLNLYIDDHV